MVVIAMETVEASQEVDSHHMDNEMVDNLDNEMEDHLNSELIQNLKENLRYSLVD